MDPLTQGVMGAVASQQIAKRSHLLAATGFGLLAGITPDLDVLIRSSNDPLLALEYHRQFTHSLFFIPFGSLICAIVFRLVLFWWSAFRDKEISFLQLWLYCLFAFASHGLLDACTTYGTQLLWPFTDARIAWNTISIIDPLFTIPLLVLILFAALKKNQLAARLALFWVVIYTSIGIFQRERAEAVGYEIATSRGHEIIRLDAKPSFANLIVWKIVYETETEYYVDAVKVGLNKKVYQGDAVPKLNIAESFPWLLEDSQQAKDIERFRWFSNDYVAVSPRFPNRIIDIRYSLIPNEIDALWGIDLDETAGADEHIEYVTSRERDGNTFSQLWSMIVD
jgi:inner membrane protein